MAQPAPYWLGTASPAAPRSTTAQTPVINARKFDTVAGGHGPDRGHVGLGFLDQAFAASDNVGLDADLGFKAKTDRWSVSVAEQASKVKRKKRSKKTDPVLTLYVTTPSQSLTLVRSRVEVIDLDRKMRSDLPGHVPTLPPLEPLHVEPKKRTVLAALTRTLNPRRTTTPPGSPGHIPSTGSDLTALSRWFTEASSDAQIRAHPVWKSFFTVGSDDLESARATRRITRTRSDITSHLASSVSHPMSLDELVVAKGKREASGSIPESIVSPDQHSLASPAPSTVVLSPAASSDASSPGDLFDVSRFSDLHAATTNSRAVPSMTDMTDAEVTEEGSTLEGGSDDVIELASRTQTADQAQHRSRDSRTIVVPSSEEKAPRRGKTSSRDLPLNIDSFEIMRVLGKGCAGKVLLVRRRDSGQLFALKAIHKRHVLAHRELQHTITEQQVLKRCSRDQSNPFVVRLHYSFHDAETLYLALDFHNGGDLATQLARWGRLGRDRARFYTAEIVEGVEGLHKAGVIYRDLKPENILISSEGHCVLTDFGLSKDFGHAKPDVEGVVRPHWLGSPSMRSSSAPVGPWASAKRETTSTFCGTAEYLAPEVLLGTPYSYEVDAWSCGTLLYEMLAGVTPFWSDSHADMYRKVLHDPLSFADTDERVFDDDTKNLLRGMLQKDPLLRMTNERIKRHPYFAMIDWGHIFARRYVAPFIPSIDPLDDTDTQNFDETFLTMAPAVKGADGEIESGREAPEGEPQEGTDVDGNDVFDGYSYYGAGDEESILSDEQDEQGQEAVERDREDDTGETGFSSFYTDAHTTLVDKSSSTLASRVSSPVVVHEQLQEEEDSTDALNHSNEVLVAKPRTQEDDEDDEWDVVDKVVGGLSARNGGKGTLFSLGVKDRFRLVVSNKPASAVGHIARASPRSLSRRFTPPTSSTGFKSVLKLEERSASYRLGSHRSINSSTLARLSSAIPSPNLESTRSVHRTSIPPFEGLELLNIDAGASLLSPASSRNSAASRTESGSSTPSRGVGSTASVLKRALSFRPGSMRRKA